jgi:peptide alpha-N-acetyltransferase
MGKKNRHRKKGKGGKAAAAAAAAKKEKSAEELQKLSPKLQSQWKNVLKAYEMRAYKKALKLADGILKVNQHHGETLAMKGLIMSHMKPATSVDEKSHKARAEELIKLGITNNAKSNVCWHVYGLFHRANKNYNQAIKSYKAALKKKGGDMQVLKDLSCLQVHQRDYPGFLSSRAEILQIKSESAPNWLSLIVAQYVNKQYDTAIKAIKAYRGTLDEESKNKLDYSELCYLESEILITKGNYEAAVGQLKEHKKYMRDQIRFRERKVFLEMTLNNFDEAVSTYVSLFKLNPENYQYHRGYQSALLKFNDYWHTNGGLDLPIHHIQLTEAQRTILVEAYEYLKRHQPRCRAHKDILLCLTPSSDFRSVMTNVVRQAIRKCKPCEFELYRTASRCHSEGESVALETIASILEEIISFLDAGLDISGKAVDDECGTAAPTLLVFALLHLAQIRDSQGRHNDAVLLLDRGWYCFLLQCSTLG